MASFSRRKSLIPLHIQLIHGDRVARGTPCQTLALSMSVPKLDPFVVCLILTAM